MVQEISTAIAAVERWVGNPVSRTFLHFVVAHDECGDRLSNGIDRYLGNTRPVCWKCRMASSVIGYTLRKGGFLFDVKEEDIKGALGDPTFKRGLINVLNGIARYGVTRPQLLNAPFLVVYDFTHMCNLQCSHCYQDAQRALPDELDTIEAKHLIQELAEAGVVAIAFSGGEPLMRKDFFEVAAYAHEQHMFVALASNGTLITPDIARRLKEVGVGYVEISLDGKDSTYHDTLRGIDGAFERSITGIRNCVSEGIYTCIATTVTQDNYTQVPEIHKLAEDLGVARIIYFNFIPTGRGADMGEKDISPCQREDLLKFLLEQNLPGHLPEVLSTAPQFARVAVQEREGGGVPVGHFSLGDELSGKARVLADFIGGCGAGRLYCSIEPQGDVQPCVFMPVAVGNIRERSFLDTWHTAPVLRKLRDRDSLSGACHSCENKYICGGCRARAWAYFHDLTSPDPGCINNQREWDTLTHGKFGSQKGSLQRSTADERSPLVKTA